MGSIVLDLPQVASEDCLAYRPSCYLPGRGGRIVLGYRAASAGAHFFHCSCAPGGAGPTPAFHLAALRVTRPGDLPQALANDRLSFEPARDFNTFFTDIVTILWYDMNVYSIVVPSSNPPA